MLAFRNVCTGKTKSDLLFVIPRGDLLDAYCVAVLDPGLYAGSTRTWRCREEWMLAYISEAKP